MGGLGNLDFIEPKAALAEVESSSAVTSSILEIPSPDKEVKLTFTLYKVNNVQYFSAGVGVEERNASYPPYPLKLIFVQGGRADKPGVLTGRWTGSSTIRSSRLPCLTTP